MLMYEAYFTTGEKGCGVHTQSGKLPFQASESLTECAKGTGSFCQEQGLRKYGSCRRQLKGTESEIRHHGPLSRSPGRSKILNSIAWSVLNK